MALPPTFANSAALRGFRPNLIDTQPDTAAPAAAPEAPDLTNRMLQILGGQLGGTLTGGEKLSALGALLKSVSRGSQTSPQQVLQGIQQQKLGEVQNMMQLQELRKQASRKAQRDALREDLLSKARNDEERAQIRILSDESLDKYALQRLEQKAPDLEAKQKQLYTYYDILANQGKERASAYWRLVAPGQVVGSFETGFRLYSPPEPVAGAAGVPGAGGTGGGQPTGELVELTQPQPKPVVPTESENQAAYLLTRLESGFDSMKNIAARDPSAAIPSVSEKITQGVFGEDFANQFKSPERQQYIAARRNALGAALTLATGSAYTPIELEGAERSYFPQYGDDAETIKFKQNEWNVLLEAARRKAGRAGASVPSKATPKSSEKKTFTIDGKQYTISPKG